MGRKSMMAISIRLGGWVPAAVACTFSLLATFAPPALAQTADLVFVNGKVFTADTGSTIAQGFAVKDGRFIAVGSSDAMRAHIGSETQVIDLKGRLVTPGLSDGHLHGVGGGPGIDLSAT